jgi:hypothetical protein
VLSAARRPVPLLAVVVVVLVGAAVAAKPAAVAVLALVALVVATPMLGALARGAAWSLPPLIGIAFLLADTGGRSLAPGAGRYLATAVVVLAILLTGVRADAGNSAALRITALVLFTYGLLGTVYGRFVLGTADGALPLIGPMVIACLPPVRNWASRADWRLGLQAITVAGALFSIGSGLSRWGVLPATQIDVLNHEKAFLVVLSISAAIALRNVPLVLLTVSAAAVAFVAYPAATYVVAVGAAIATLVLVRWSPGQAQRIALAVGGMAATAVAILHIDELIQLTAPYFQLVGKTDNGGTRAALYSTALARLHSPLFSDFFTGDITVVGNLAGRNEVTPVHDDYLSVTLGGGLVAAVLLLGIFCFANGMALRALAASDDPWQRRTIVVLLAAVNGAAVSALANPIFMNPGASAVTFGVLAALMAACRIPERPAGAPAVPGEDALARRGSRRTAPEPAP